MWMIYWTLVVKTVLSLKTELRWKRLKYFPFTDGAQVHPYRVQMSRRNSEHERSRFSASRRRVPDLSSVFLVYSVLFVSTRRKSLRISDGEESPTEQNLNMLERET